MCGCAQATAHVEVKEQLTKFILTYYVGSRDQSLVVRFDALIICHWAQVPENSTTSHLLLWAPRLCQLPNSPD